jgi:UDP-N-acetylmuramyl pentapeptide phosphotransferase/UDP-N-acetylglucosamine-1-phosphate transferase
MNQTLLLAALGLAALLFAYTGVALLRRWALQRMLDVPNSRSSHTLPTPRGGGLAIVVCTLGGLWLAAFLLQPTPPLLLVASYSLGAILIAWVSWLDDLKSLSNRVRFGAHIAGALLVIGGIGYFHTLQAPLAPPVDIGWLGVLLAFFWLTGLTNVYNFMDGIDGLAGGQAVVAGLGWLALGLLTELPMVSALGVLVAGSSLGFLGHNWPPARIFMGDVGSAFLGFTLAMLAVIGGLADPRLPFAGVLVVWPFVFDATFTILRRLRRGENIFAAHRSHLYQRLVIAGWSHRTVTLLYLALAGIGAVLASLWVMAAPGSDWLVLVIPTLCAFGLWRLVVRVESGGALTD